MERLLSFRRQRRRSYLAFACQDLPAMARQFFVLARRVTQGFDERVLSQAPFHRQRTELRNKLSPMLCVDKVMSIKTSDF